MKSFDVIYAAMASLEEGSSRVIDPATRLRIEQTVACRDADSIPKVANAGHVFEDDRGSIQIMHNGVLIREGCYYGDWMTEIIQRLKGHHEPQEELTFHTIVSRLAESTNCPRMIEIGAFWSYYSLWLLKSCPDASVVLVEPDPNNLAAGQENFRLNSAEGRFIQSAVGPIDLPAISFHCESDGLMRTIECQSLSTIAADAGFEKVDVLLIDAQGIEADVVESSIDWIKNSVRFLLVSTHHQSISGDPLTHTRCKKVLLEAGAHFVAEHSIAESCSGDGLIAVSFDEHDADLLAEITYSRAHDSLFGDPVIELAQNLQKLKVLEAELDLTRHKLDKLQLELANVNATLTMRLRNLILRKHWGRILVKVIRARQFSR